MLNAAQVVPGSVRPRDELTLAKRLVHDDIAGEADWTERARLRAECLTDLLDLRGPVLRVTGFDVPYPYWQIEDAYMPSADRVAAAAQRLLTEF